MPLCPGTSLCRSDRMYVFVAYVHRFTNEHRPRWASVPRPNGEPYPVQFASDADWLRHTLFHVKKDGSLDRRFAYCESHPTWSNNPELRTGAGA